MDVQSKARAQDCDSAPSNPTQHRVTVSLNDWFCHTSSRLSTILHSLLDIIIFFSAVIVQPALLRLYRHFLFPRTPLNFARLLCSFTLFLVRTQHTEPTPLRSILRFS
jgi:hypothetical protein